MGKIIFCIFLIFFSCTKDNNFKTISNIEYIGIENSDIFNTAIIIKEVAYHNDKIESSSGETAAFVRLYNTSNDSQNIGDYYLSDNVDNVKKYHISSYSKLASDNYYLIFLNGKNAEKQIDTNSKFDIFGSFAWSWADDQNSIKGHSHVYYNLFKNKLFEKVSDDSIIISARLKILDNSDVGLAWSSAVVGMNIENCTEKSGKDFSDYDYLVVKTKIDNGKKIRIRICQVGLDDYKSYGFDLDGTGEFKYYKIPLPNGGILDKTKIYSIQWTLPSNVYDSVSFTTTKLFFDKMPKYEQANFKLSLGETLYLFNSKTQKMDVCEYRVTSQGQSLIRNLNSGKWFINDSIHKNINEIDKDVSNIEKYVNLLALPRSGSYVDSVNVKVLSSEKGKIYYTLNGVEPTEKSNCYNGNLVLKETSALKLKMIDEKKVSKTLSMTYFINDSSSLPVISLVVDSLSMFDNDSGIYQKGDNASSSMPYYGANYWLDKELPVNISMFDKGRLLFSEYAGLKIFGNYSRMKDNKAFSIHFKSKYGVSKLNYPLFANSAPDVNRFDSFILRTNGNTSQSVSYHDALIQTFIGFLGVDHQKYRPAILYINGKYWGIYNIREKLNADYIENNYGFNAEDISIFKDGWVVQSGNCQSYLEIGDYIKSGGNFKSDENFKFFTSRVDIDNAINFFLSEMYIGNHDWPTNNYKVWRYNKSGFKWQYIIYDTDISFSALESSYEDNMFDGMSNGFPSSWPNGSNYEASLLWRKLIENKDFRSKYINRAVVALKTIFTPDRFSDSIESFDLAVQKEKNRHLKRWKISSFYWNSSKDDMKDFAAKRGGIFLKHMESFFGLGEKHNLNLDIEGNGNIIVSTIRIVHYPFIAKFYKDYPVELKAVPDSKSVFVGWSDGEKASVRKINLLSDIELKAIFK